MFRVCCDVTADRLVAARAKRVIVSAELKVFLDFDTMRIRVAGDASRAAFQEALALPQADGVIGEASRTQIGPIGRVLGDGLIVLENGQEMIVVIISGVESRNKNIAERMALRTNHGVAVGSQTGLHYDVLSCRGFRLFTGIMCDVVAAGSMSALVVGAEIEPRIIVMVASSIEAFLLLADVAGKALLVADLGFDFATFIGVSDIKVVEPLSSENVPTGRQHDNPAVG
jgi:hypothetical protein